MKVIFLDIDGVMNSEVFYRERHKKLIYRIKRNYYKIKKIFIKPKSVNLLNYKVPDKYYTFEYQFKRLQKETDSLKWKWLSEFCNENGYKICISSVWKNIFKDSRNWEAVFLNLGFNLGIYWGITGSRRTLRGTEIKEWLKLHPEITDYAILDDDSDMLPEQMDKFHHCDPYYGLTPNHLYRIKRQFEKLETKTK